MVVSCVFSSDNVVFVVMISNRNSGLSVVFGGRMIGGRFNVSVIWWFCGLL